MEPEREARPPAKSNRADVARRGVFFNPVKRVRECMPKTGFKSLTVREDIYMLAEKIYESDELKVRYRTLSHVFELAVVEYAKKHHPEIYEKFLEEIKEKKAS